MGSKATFADDEWKDLQWALMLAGSHITASDWPGVWKSFKVAAGGSRFLTMMQGTDDQLIADLTKDQARKRPPEIADRAGLQSEVAIARIHQAAQLVADKAPEDLADVALAESEPGQVPSPAGQRPCVVGRVEAGTEVRRSR